MRAAQRPKRTEVESHMNTTYAFHGYTSQHLDPPPLPLLFRDGNHFAYIAPCERPGFIGSSLRFHHSEVIYSGLAGRKVVFIEVSRGEKILFSGTDSESYIEENTLVYEDRRLVYVDECKVYEDKRLVYEDQRRSSNIAPGDRDKFTVFNRRVALVFRVYCLGFRFSSNKSRPLSIPLFIVRSKNVSTRTAAGSH